MSDEQKPKPAPSRKQRPASQSTEIVAIALKRGIELFHNSDGDAYARVPVSEHHETLSLTGRAVKEYLAREYFRVRRQIPNASAISDAITALAGSARYSGPLHDVHTRLAAVSGAIYLDLGRPEWNAVRITTEGWQVDASPAVRFRRSKGLLALPEPTRNGDLTALRALLNVPDDDTWRLLIAWLVGALRGRPAYPVLVVNGEHGSTKSWFTRIARRLIDPHTTAIRRPPKDSRDLMIAAKNSHVIAFDNLSAIAEWLSDDLCCLSTGSGFATRELHTDDVETIFAAARPVIVNGITEVVSRPDLLDRAIVITLNPIPDSKRRTERDIESAFQAVHPGALGALLDAVVLALRDEEHTVLRSLPRMADFATWIAAAEPALPWERGAFLSSYLANRLRAIEALLDGDPIAEAVREVVDARQEPWIGTAASLYSLLSTPDVAMTKDWPRNARTMAGALRRKAPALRQLGIDVRFGRSNGERVITLSRTPTQQRLLDRDDTGSQLDTKGAEDASL
jgi:hypothetical protein